MMLIPPHGGPNAGMQSGGGAADLNTENVSSTNRKKPRSGGEGEDPPDRKYSTRCNTMNDKPVREIERKIERN